MDSPRNHHAKGGWDLHQAPRTKAGNHPRPSSDHLPTTSLLLGADSDDNSQSVEPDHGKRSIRKAAKQRSCPWSRLSLGRCHSVEHDKYNANKQVDRATHHFVYMHSDVNTTILSNEKECEDERYIKIRCWVETKKEIGIRGKSGIQTNHILSQNSDSTDANTKYDGERARKQGRRECEWSKRGCSVLRTTISLRVRSECRSRKNGDLRDTGSSSES